MAQHIDILFDQDEMLMYYGWVTVSCIGLTGCKPTMELQHGSDWKVISGDFIGIFPGGDEEILTSTIGMYRKSIIVTMVSCAYLSPFNGAVTTPI